MPVHGEQLHLAEHAKIARAAGVADVIKCQNGDVVRLAPDARGKVDEVARRATLQGRPADVDAGGSAGGC